MTDFNSTKFDLIRILSFVKISAEAVFLYRRSVRHLSWALTNI